MVNKQTHGPGFMEREFAQLRLGDRRLDVRFQKVMQQFLERPGKSINGASSNWAESKAAYRLFSNDDLTEEKILSAHGDQILERARCGSGDLIAVQDTTALSYTMHFHAEGLGSIAMGACSRSSKGLFVHTGYLLEESGVSLGCAEQIIWSRAQLQVGDELWFTEHNRWRMALKASSEIGKACGRRVIHVADREADTWDYLSDIANFQDDFVVRAVKRGKSKNNEVPHICRAMQEAKDLGEITLKLEICKYDEGNRRLRSRKKEQVRLRVLARELDLSGTKYFKENSRNKGLKVNAVRLLEIDPPSDREPIDWILKTSLLVDTLSDCLRVVEIYKLRWQIENFHRVLKAGMKIEESRLEHADRLKKLVVCLSIVAWRIHQLTLLGRECPDLPCTIALRESEWKALYCKIKKSAAFPKQPPGLNQAMRWIAQLGGFLGRKGDGNPGSTTIWRGWERVMDMAEVFEIITNEQQGATYG
jgi:hypothetical protein